jgi:hypothetical protein
MLTLVLAAVALTVALFLFGPRLPSLGRTVLGRRWAAMLAAPVALPRLATLLAVVVAVMALPLEAFAQSAPPAASTRIDFSPLIGEVLVPMLVALGGVLATWLTARLATWFKIADDAKIRELLESAIENGIALALSRLGNVSASIEVRNQAVADAANYVIRATPDALKRFNVDPQALAEKIEARLAKREQAPAVPPAPAGT